MSQEEYKGEKYFNKYALAPYALVILSILYYKEPGASLQKLLVGTMFMVVWTFLVGIVACIFVILPVVTSLKETSAARQFTDKYFLWFPPAIGMAIFIVFASSI